MNNKNVSCFGFHGPCSELMVFKLAFNFAEMGLNILFITPEQFEELPHRTELIPDKDALKLMTFMYVKEIEILLKEINSVYLWHKKPNILIINNFHYYLENFLEEEEKMAFIISFILSATLACANILEKQIKVFYSYNSNFEENILKLFVDLYNFKVVQLLDLTDDIFNKLLRRILYDV